MAGKMAPRPSSPFSRSSTQASARRMRRLAHHGRDQRIDAPRQHDPVRRRCAPGAFPLPRQPEVVMLFLRRLGEELAHVDAARIARHRLQRAEDEERHHHRPRPVGDLVDVEGKPPRHQHDLDGDVGHRPPGNLAEERERDPREDVDARGAAARQDRLAGPPHVRRVRVVTGQLQRVVGLDGAAEIELAAMVERPAAVSGLVLAQIDRELALERPARSHPDNASSGCIRPEWCSRPRARRASARRASAARSVHRAPRRSPGRAAPCGRSARARTASAAARAPANSRGAAPAWALGGHGREPPSRCCEAPSSSALTAAARTAAGFSGTAAIRERQASRGALEELLQHAVVAYREACQGPRHHHRRS